MMKLFYNLQRGVGLFVFCTILLSACVNHISEEEEDSVNNGDIPLKFIADIRESVGTRMANNNFAEGDAGLERAEQRIYCYLGQWQTFETMDRNFQNQVTA